MSNFDKAYKILKTNNGNTQAQLAKAWDLIKDYNADDFNQFDIYGPTDGMTVIERATIWAEDNDDIQRRLERAVMVIRQHKHITTEVYENAEQVAKWGNRFNDVTWADYNEFAKNHSEDDTWICELIVRMAEEMSRKGL